MKKIFFSFLFFFFFLPIFVFAEEISDYRVDITINEDATINVVEEIHYDFGDAMRHGIYRDIPVKYKTAGNNNRSIQLRNISVTDLDGEVYVYDVLKEGRNKRIKIGEAHTYVTGEKVYVVSYSVKGAMNYFDTHDELYWNVIGDQWTVPIARATVTIHAPHIINHACYFGAYGSKTPCDTVTQDTEEQIVISQKNITPGNNVTAVIGMPAGTVYKPSGWEKALAMVMQNSLVLLPVFVGIFMWRKWYQRGRDPEGRGSVVPYYNAPHNMSPGYADVIVHEKIKNASVSAMIVDLAVKGFVTIRRIDEGGIFSSADYEITKTEKSIEESDVTPDEKKLYHALFKYGNGKTIKISQLKDVFYTDLSQVKKIIRENIVRDGYYPESPNSVRITYFAIAGLLLFGLFFVGPFIVPFFGSLGIVAIVLSAVIIGVFGYFMPQVTRKGAHMREQLSGLKLYMEKAEKDRINFHNAPEKDPKQFEKLLPYAMVFGVEEQWAKQFEDIYDRQPEWYEGTGTFAPAVLAHEMQNLSSAAASTMSSTPSSASSGGSGFSGGGGGGGFGGGGGGSW
ncbi:MAG: hypothetical protein CR972_03725 [Candidatus Moraniibacteriota bacterium]|nr:MAG: hypothetical protein CR972_03725 [Candidatus Moranbacteria bacterium]